MSTLPRARRLQKRCKFSLTGWFLVRSDYRPSVSVVRSHSATSPHGTPPLQMSASVRYLSPPPVLGHIRPVGCHDSKKATTHPCFLTIFPNHRNERPGPGAVTGNEMGHLIQNHTGVLTRGNLGSWTHIRGALPGDISERKLTVPAETGKLDSLPCHIPPCGGCDILLCPIMLLLHSFLYLPESTATSD